MAMEDSHAGQAIYTPAVLAIYDLFVLGISNHFIWRCPTYRLLAHYNQHISAVHLDVGVGTGYFLDRCRFPAAQPRLALFDLSPHSLARTARRVRRYKPAVYRGDVLKLPPIEPDSFASIGLNYLLHCLPGSIRTKGIVFDHLKPLLQPGGVIFGSTILNGGVQHSRVSRWLMEAYNRRGTFSNRADDLEGLRDALGARWAHHEVETCGRVALFAARD